MVLDIGHLIPWVVNDSTALFLTVALALAHVKTVPELLKDFGAGFLLGGVLPIIIALIMTARKKAQVIAE